MKSSEYKVAYFSMEIAIEQGMPTYSGGLGIITNGVHVATWTSLSFQKLFDRYISGWQEDNFSLRYAVGIPPSEIWDAHVQAKNALLNYIKKEMNTRLDPDYFTIGFARRATSYKRADLIFHDIERLKQVAHIAGPIQFLFGGKAHPKDFEGKELIKRIFQAKESLKGNLKVVYLENYDIALAKMLTSGFDLWLNTPLPPFEASGTSGMKAALNGIPSFSVLDGWWIEGCIEGFTGWSIGKLRKDNENNDYSAADVNSLYEKLEKEIVPMFYSDRDSYINIMRHSMAFNGSFFNTQRMLQQYVLKAYFG